MLICDKYIVEFSTKCLLDKTVCEQKVFYIFSLSIPFLHPKKVLCTLKKICNYSQFTDLKNNVPKFVRIICPLSCFQLLPFNVALYYSSLLQLKKKPLHQLVLSILMIFHPSLFRKGILAGLKVLSILLVVI